MKNMELSYRSIFIKELNFNMMKGKKRGREEESKEEKRRGEGGKRQRLKQKLYFYTVNIQLLAQAPTATHDRNLGCRAHKL